MKNLIIAVFTLMLAPLAQAEYRQVELTIFGMD